MTVYVLTSVYQSDSGDCSNTVVGVYETFDLANKKFKQEMKDARTDMAGLEVEESNYCDGDMEWSIWEADNYCYNHIDLAIRECEVEEEE